MIGRACIGDDLPQRLQGRLRQPLPGRVAQRRMASELAYGRHFGPASWNARPAAVLVLLYQDQSSWRIPLTLRPDHMLDHAGQVSLPGGTHECGESVERCAIREYAEELGGCTADITAIGRLSPIYVFASNFRVTPCVAVANRRPTFDPNPEEVARVLELTLDDLLDPASQATHVMRRGGICFRSRHLRCQGERVWGATAMILAEFAAVVAQSLNRPDEPGSISACLSSS